MDISRELVRVAKMPSAADEKDAVRKKTNKFSKFESALVRFRDAYYDVAKEWDAANDAQLRDIVAGVLEKDGGGLQFLTGDFADLEEGVFINALIAALRAIRE